jgi:cytoskeletal protein CcmA (bactofilin family)
LIKTFQGWLLNRLGLGIKQADSGQSGPNQISAEILIAGNITSRRDIYLYGRVEGDVTCRRLFLAADAVIGGRIDVEQQIALPLEPEPTSPLGAQD